jgi:hypothetical protein
MKKDLPFILGGLAVGAIVLFVFKDKIMGKPKAKSSSEGAGVPVTTAGIGPSTGSAPAPQPQTGGVKAPPAQGQQTAGGAEQPVQQAALPYAPIAIDPSLAGSEWHQKIFGGCSFPITAGASNPCVGRLQAALDVEPSGSFDMATQEAFDEYIEIMPNRADGPFAGWGRQGCISFDAGAGQESNTCGLNQDQYLDILFKMGIPLSGEYE